MNRRSAVRFLLTAGAGSLVDPVNSQAEKDEYTIHTDVRLVLLDVSVTGRRGAPVAGLGKSNFEVLEDGKRRQITTFTKNDEPVTMGILVDESESMTPKRADVVTAALTLIHASNPADEIFVLNFNDTVKSGLPEGMLFSDDAQELRAALARESPRGKTALNDAVAAGLDQLGLGKRARKALVAISDGGDNASHRSRSDVIAMIESHIATIYTVGLYSPEDREIDPGFLRRIARVSGGHAYFPASAAETIPICRSIARDIRARYTIGFVPEAPVKGGNQLHHLEVRAYDAQHNRLNAHTRTSYRYDDHAQ